MSELSLVILAAGMASRFGEPKQLKPLGPGNNALLEYTAYDAIRAGFRNIVFVIQTPLAHDFIALAERLPGNVSVQFAFQDKHWPDGIAKPQRTKPWGTGHALLAAQHLVNGPFVMCNADDHYGLSAFVKAADFLRTKDLQTSHFGMLGYRLEATLSGQGSVSRALCEISDDGHLASVSEHPKIRSRNNMILSEIGPGEEIELSKADPVSMNFWMLAPSIFPFLDAEFRAFIEQYRDDPAAEYRLPDIVQGLVQQGEITVDCLPHDDAWFGLTYSADFEKAMSATRAMHDKGMYPTPLWKNDGK